MVSQSIITLVGALTKKKISFYRCRKNYTHIVPSHLYRKRVDLRNVGNKVVSMFMMFRHQALLLLPFNIVLTTVYFVKILDSLNAISFNRRMMKASLQMSSAVRWRE